MSVRYYLYISESKVEQLFEQIPTKRLSKIAKKLTIDLKLLKAEFGTRDQGAQQSLYEKVRVVERYLHDSGVVGVDEVESDEGPMFFAGRMPLRWGRLDDRQVVYFSGRTSDTLLGMGGSTRHLQSAAEGGQSLRVGSAAPDLIEALRGDRDGELFERPGWPVGFNDDDLPLLMLSPALHRGKASKLTFLALALHAVPIPSDPAVQRLFKGERRALLGTPVFVAMEQ